MDYMKTLKRLGFLANALDCFGANERRIILYSDEGADI
jgi:hypothetical protein